MAPSGTLPTLRPGRNTGLMGVVKVVRFAPFVVRWKGENRA